MVQKIKEILFKIKDYDRLESDYCNLVCHMTMGRMSKSNYYIDEVKAVADAAQEKFFIETFEHAFNEILKTEKSNKKRIEMLEMYFEYMK